MARVPARLLFGFVLALATTAALLQSSSAQQPDPGKATTERTPASLQKGCLVVLLTVINVAVYSTYRTVFAAALAETKDFEGGKKHLNALPETSLSEGERQQLTAMRTALNEGKPYRLQVKSPMGQAQQPDGKSN
jgi:hypothetical protein